MSVMAELARYARLAYASTNLTRWLFNLTAAHLSRACSTRRSKWCSTRHRPTPTTTRRPRSRPTAPTRELRPVGRSFWDGRTVKGLLVWELGKSDIGYEIVDWGSFALPETDPA